MQVNEKGIQIKFPARTPFYLLLQTGLLLYVWPTVEPSWNGKGEAALGGRGQSRRCFERTLGPGWQKARALLPMYRWSSLGSSRTCWHRHMEQTGDEKQRKEEQEKS